VQYYCLKKATTTPFHVFSSFLFISHPTTWLHLGSAARPSLKNNIRSDFFETFTLTKKCININVCPVNATTESFLRWKKLVCMLCVNNLDLNYWKKRSGSSFYSVENKLIFQLLDASKMLHWTAFINCYYYVSHCPEKIF
jgi:hypothetical protein